MAKKKLPTAKIVNFSPGRGLNIRLRGKRLANGVISLYLDYYQGYKKMPDGKIKTIRKVEYLKIYLAENPSTTLERNKNNENLILAQNIRNHRESDQQHNSEGLVAPYRKKSNFFDYCQAYIDKYPKKDIRMIKLAIFQFKEYTKETHLNPKQVDKAKVIGFRDYLLGKYKGETPNSVFARFKKVLAAATDDGLFSRNPGEKVTCKVPYGIPKDILTFDEVKKLSRAECGNNEVKRAFLLCLYTGLRYCDVKGLQYRHITNGLIKMPQQKTGREVTINLNPQAKKLIGEMGKPKESVFSLPSHTGCSKSLKKWTEKAKIQKHITWHCARHSFATMLMVNDTDIITVKNLMGHSKLENTQKYTHVVDALKEKAVNTLPDLDL